MFAFQRSSALARAIRGRFLAQAIGVDRSRHAQDHSSSSVVLLPRGSTLSRRGLLTSRAAIVAPRTPEGDKLTSRAAVVAPRTPEGD